MPVFAFLEHELGWGVVSQMKIWVSIRVGVWDRRPSRNDRTNQAPQHSLTPPLLKEALVGKKATPVYEPIGAKQIITNMHDDRGIRWRLLG